MNNIILHGCTFGSNFGDCLFAKLFYDECERVNPGYNKLYDNKFIIKNSEFRLSEHYRNYINYHKKCRFIDIIKCKGIVFFGGGYFGETTNSHKEAIIRYYRYLKLGLFARLLKKPVAIIGVEAGPISVKFLKKSIKKLFNYADIVAVRNTDSAKFLKEIGVKNNVIITADPAININKDIKPDEDKTVQEIRQIFLDKKILLFHSITNTTYLKLVEFKVIPALNKFLMDNPEYGVVFTYDQVTSTEKIDELKSLAKKIENTKVYINSYKDPTKLINLIEISDLIITTKLHVGIIGSSLSKSVISIPFNSNKILRYYDYINESGRCTPIKETDENTIYNQLNKYNGVNINLSNDLIMKSKENYDLLDHFINSIVGK